MAVLTLRARESPLVGNFTGQAMVEADQTLTTSATGWTVAKVAAANSAAGSALIEQGSAVFTAESTTPKPPTPPNTTQAYRTLGPLRGQFAATAWSIVFVVRSVTAVAGAGRIRVRVGAGSEPTTGNAIPAYRDITAAVQVGSTVTLSISADGSSTVTWTPAAPFRLEGEFLYVAFAWEITTAGGNNSSDVLLRLGSSTTGTRVVTSDFVPDPEPEPDFRRRRDVRRWFPKHRAARYCEKWERRRSGIFVPSEFGRLVVPELAGV